MRRLAHFRPCRPSLVPRSLLVRFALASRAASAPGCGGFAHFRRSPARVASGFKNGDRSTMHVLSTRHSCRHAAARRQAWASSGHLLWVAP
jgi:hypothetical protein